MKFGIRELLFLVLLSAIPAGSYFWVFQPAQINLQNKQCEIDKKTEKLASLNKAVAGIEDLNAEVEKLVEAVEFFESKLPARHEIHKILEQVTKIADKRGLETKLFKALKQKPFATYSEQPIKMEVHGDFDAFYQFLLDLEKLARITRIKNIQLIKDKKNEGQMDAHFTLSIFFDNSTSKSK